MAESFHLWLLLVLVVSAVWWTKHWLLTRLISRWRYAIAGGVSTLLWIIVAYASTRYIVTTGGVEFTYQAMSVAYMATFMAFVSVVGILLGLLTWAEEEGRDASEELPDRMTGDLGD